MTPRLFYVVLIIFHFQMAHCHPWLRRWFFTPPSIFEVL